MLDPNLGVASLVQTIQDTVQDKRNELEKEIEEVLKGKKVKDDITIYITEKDGTVKKFSLKEIAAALQLVKKDDLNGNYNPDTASQIALLKSYKSAIGNEKSISIDSKNLHFKSTVVGLWFSKKFAKVMNPVLKEAISDQNAWREEQAEIAAAEREMTKAGVPGGLFGFLEGIFGKFYGSLNNELNELIHDGENFFDGARNDFNKAAHSIANFFKGL